jgi:hypothetical protein
MRRGDAGTDGPWAISTPRVPLVHQRPSLARQSTRIEAPVGASRALPEHHGELAGAPWPAWCATRLKCRYADTVRSCGALSGRRTARWTPPLRRMRAVVAEALGPGCHACRSNGPQPSPSTSPSAGRQQQQRCLCRSVPAPLLRRVSAPPVVASKSPQGRTESPARGSVCRPACGPKVGPSSAGDLRPGSNCDPEGFMSPPTHLPAARAWGWAARPSEESGNAGPAQSSRCWSIQHIAQSGPQLPGLDIGQPGQMTARKHSRMVEARDSRSAGVTMEPLAGPIVQRL